MENYIAWFLYITTYDIDATNDIDKPQYQLKHS